MHAGREKVRARRAGAGWAGRLAKRTNNHAGPTKSKRQNMQMHMTWLETSPWPRVLQAISNSRPVKTRSDRHAWRGRLPRPDGMAWAGSPGGPAREKDGDTWVFQVTLPESSRISSEAGTLGCSCLECCGYNLYRQNNLSKPCSCFIILGGQSPRIRPRFWIQKEEVREAVTIPRFTLVF
jgi:hypothetical protein